MDRKQIKEREKKLMEMTAAFCVEKLNAEYLFITEKLIRKMGRKRDVPFKRGKLEIWAASVIYAIGYINYLFHEGTEPYVSPKEIHDYFGTKQSTVSNKAREIRKMFKMNPFDSEFLTEENKFSNPFSDMVVVDGFIVPMSMLPESLQELVRKERAAGRDIEFYTEPDE